MWDETGERLSIRAPDVDHLAGLRVALDLGGRGAACDGRVGHAAWARSCAQRSEHIRRLLRRSIHRAALSYSQAHPVERTDFHDPRPRRGRRRFRQQEVARLRHVAGPGRVAGTQTVRAPPEPPHCDGFESS